MSQTLEIRFDAIDTLYFRGSRPHSAAGASALESDFPPPSSTFTGALRTRLGDAIDIDWSDLTEAGGNTTSQSGQQFAGVDVGQLIGDADNTGLLQFSEPYLVKDGERLYPVPAALLKSESGLVCLQAGEPVRCDLGLVCLPQLPAGTQLAAPLHDHWITVAGLQQFLQGKIPDEKHLVSLHDLVTYESRLGIGRNVAAATVEAGLMYQTEHLRLNQGVGFGIQLTLPAASAEVLITSIDQQPLQRFGGEGRMASLSVNVTDNGNTRVLPAAPEKPNALLLLTDLLPEADSGVIPFPGFSRQSHNGIESWEGQIHGVALRVITVAGGKSVKRGGWDVRHNRPKAVQSFTPAGTCFYVQPLDDTQDLLSLHGKQVGRVTHTGYGTLACAFLN